MSGLPKRRPGKTRRYAPAVENPAAQRLIIKVASLYHTHGLRQKEIADRLAISQSRVSRLLTQAEEVGIVRTVVAVPLHLHAGLEDAVEREYDVDEVHVVESVGSTNAALRLDLGVAAAAILGEVSLEAATVGWTSWSRTLRAVVDNLLPLHLGTKHVVEMVGDLGAPALQHEAAASTQRLARLLGAEPVFLRTPGVVSSRAVADALLHQDAFASQALGLLDQLDIALLSIGGCAIEEPLQAGRNMFSRRQIEEVRRAGAVGEVCLRYIDADGRPVDSPLNEVTIGVTMDQLLHVGRRWVVAGGERKREAVRAAVRGGWVDVLVTDVDTARYLVS